MLSHKAIKRCHWDLPFLGLKFCGGQMSALEYRTHIHIVWRNVHDSLLFSCADSSKKILPLILFQYVPQVGFVLFQRLYEDLNRLRKGLIEFRSSPAYSHVYYRTRTKPASFQD